MTTTTDATALIERQVAGLNAGELSDVTAMYADDAVLVVVSPHTLPGSELRLSGREAIEKHMGRVLKGGIADVVIDWIGAGDGFVAWRDSGTVGGGLAFSEAHTAVIRDGAVVEHVLHSVYRKG